ncbi:hypothetical protein EK21DRAFT_59571 [Setomelanomma holmii]|uniref:Zn(2)-C6 fungal-type domain-containing protein n=1 Tax=Setomelanomma holmii TaxID=210430 RepID=A0A9P4LQR0_9PLEO|nr:hypothetical protein EK21DRAFT_59571 [Setomelanomma holmii]
MPLQTQGKRRSAAQDVPVKRFRVSRACDQCRTERSKCDGNQPQCAPCFESKRTCTYTSNPRKRGLPPGYIRTIELALALVYQENPEIEASLITRLGQDHTVLLARDTKESNRLHRSWRRTKFCRELNKTLTGEQEDDRALSSDSDSEPQETKAPFQLSSVQPVMPTARELVTTSPIVHRQPEMQKSMHLEQLTPLPPDSWRLLDIYASYIQCWLPISEKLDVLKLSYSYPAHGLVLGPEIPDSGHHAEMWSIFALASYQEICNGYGNRNHLDSANPDKIYHTAKSLIPNERGKFDLGHVKALLNLALFNLRNSRHDAAWLLVGAASRILPIISSLSPATDPRHQHVLASCYILDSLLALLLDRRPYLNRSDLEGAGKIEEDGLEEWYPWDGHLANGVALPSRSPTLALSSFNRLLEVVDILRNTRQRLNATQSENLSKELVDWKASLVKKTSKSLPLDQATQLNISKVTTNFSTAQASGAAGRAAHSDIADTHTQRASVPSAQYAESIRPSSSSFPQQFNNSIPARHQHGSNPLLQDLLPDMNHSQPAAPVQSFSPLDTEFTSPTMDGYDPSISGDLESFFDELASLHGAKKLQNQPQFMQNLGFAPEVSMADLLATQSGQYSMPMNTSTFGTEHEGEPIQFPLSDYYDAS